MATRLSSSRARSPPERLATVVSTFSTVMPNCASRERRWRLGGLGQRAADDRQRRVVGVHRLDLVLVEPADLHAPVAVTWPPPVGRAPAISRAKVRLARRR